MANSKLPRTTQYFLRHTSPPVERIVRSLHRWMAQRRLAIGQLKPRHVNRFLDRPRRRKVSAQTRANYRRLLLPYLQYLADKNHLGFDPYIFCVPKPPPLPSTAAAFVALLAPTHKRSTLAGYQQALRAFHLWLEQHQRCLSRLARDDMMRWFVHLHDRGLHPTSRCHAIIKIRAYLRWLDDHHVLNAHPEDLIRRTDLPKRPDYLPRPLPPEVDRELQRRLADSTDHYQLGLLLMRNTGIRVGELVSLQRNCIRTDNNGHRFIKVPLGKLDNERLVPIDPTTFKLIQHLQHQRPADRQWLLVTPIGTSTRHVQYNRILRHVCHDLDIPDRLTTHRLRHTYATSLLNAGMSLMGVMKLLGHRSVKMTLRYAAITQQTVQDEYFKAFTQLKQRYSHATASMHPSQPDPHRMLSDIARWVTASLENIPQRQVQALLKRIKRLQAAIEALAPR